MQDGHGLGGGLVTAGGRPLQPGAGDPEEGQQGKGQTSPGCQRTAGAQGLLPLRRQRQLPGPLPAVLPPPPGQEVYYSSEDEQEGVGVSRTVIKQNQLNFHWTHWINTLDIGLKTHYKD